MTAPALFTDPDRTETAPIEVVRLLEGYKPVPDFPGYRVGDDGSVWSCKTRRSLGYGGGSRTVLSDEWHRLNPKFRRRGYLAVGLSKPDSPKTYVFSVHRLVLLAFVGPCPKGMEACHENGNREDNRLTNLRWDTRRANHADRVRHGRSVGETHGNAKLTVDAVRQLRRRYDAGESLPKLAAEFGINRGNAWGVVTRKRWTHVKD
jgi:hypothetical protein